MNIFYLHHNPITAASYTFDSHAVKMPLESLQILSTIVNFYYPNYNDINLMKPTHINHPCVIWARTSAKNFDWLIDHCEALFDEYQSRYNRVHACRIRFEALDSIFSRVYKLLIANNKIDFTEPAFCMPDECKVVGNPVLSYRNLYAHKQKLEANKVARYENAKSLGLKIYPDDNKPVRKIALKMVWQRTSTPKWTE